MVALRNALVRLVHLRFVRARGADAAGLAGHVFDGAGGEAGLDGSQGDGGAGVGEDKGRGDGEGGREC